MQWKELRSRLGISCRVPLIGVLIAAALCASPGASLADEVRWTKSRVHYSAQRKDVRDVLREFALYQGLTADIAGNVSGFVTGSFDMDPTDFLDRLAGETGFDWFVEDAVLRVKASSKETPEELKLRLGTIADLQQTLARLSTLERRAPPEASAAPAGEEPRDWEVTPSDKTLNTAVARWAAAAGWQLVWELPHDYMVEAQSTFNGTFEEAVSAIARSMEGADAPMRAIFYSGNKVLRIVAKEDK